MTSIKQALNCSLDVTHGAAQVHPQFADGHHVDSDQRVVHHGVVDLVHQPREASFIQAVADVGTGQRLADSEPGCDDSGIFCRHGRRQAVGVGGDADHVVTFERLQRHFAG